jgi:hypothetical protein
MNPETKREPAKRLSKMTSDRQEVDPGIIGRSDFQATSWHA